MKKITLFFILLSSLSAQDNCSTKMEYYNCRYYPNDLYSEEEHGPLGFLDDLMLILVVLRKCSIQEDAGIEFIKKFTGELNYPIDSLLTTDYDKITKENKVLFEDLLTVSGMRFYYKDY